MAAEREREERGDGGGRVRRRRRWLGRWGRRRGREGGGWERARELLDFIKAWRNPIRRADPGTRSATRLPSIPHALSLVLPRPQRLTGAHCSPQRRRQAALRCLHLLCLLFVFFEHNALRRHRTELASFGQRHRRAPISLQIRRLDLLSPKSPCRDSALSRLSHKSVVRVLTLRIYQPTRMHSALSGPVRKYSHQYIAPQNHDMRYSILRGSSLPPNVNRSAYAIRYFICTCPSSPSTPRNLCDVPCYYDPPVPLLTTK